jgi:hypothetical protein
MKNGRWLRLLAQMLMDRILVDSALVSQVLAGQMQLVTGGLNLDQRRPLSRLKPLRLKPARQ